MVGQTVRLAWRVSWKTNPRVQASQTLLRIQGDLMAPDRRLATAIAGIDQRTGSGGSDSAARRRWRASGVAVPRHPPPKILSKVRPRLLPSDARQDSARGRHSLHSPSLQRFQQDSWMVTITVLWRERRLGVFVVRVLFAKARLAVVPAGLAWNGDALVLGAVHRPKSGQQLGLPVLPRLASAVPATFDDAHTGIRADHRAVFGLPWRCRLPRRFPCRDRRSRARPPSPST